MKYLKKYNELNESISDVTDMKEIEELFYPISDEHINVEAAINISQLIRFDKPIIYFFDMISPKENMCQLNTDIHHLGSNQLITVTITKSPIITHSLINKPEYKLNINPFSEDLRFAIEYLGKEKGLNLKQIYVCRQELYNSNYPINLYYKDLNTLLSDDIASKSILSLILYFGD